MQLDAAIELITRQIKTDAKHRDYNRTTELADTYRTFITGDGIEKKLIQFVQREDAGLFAQRVQLTRSTTPAVASSIRQPFNKVIRNNRIKWDIKVPNEDKIGAIVKMASMFYGSSRSKNKGLDYWLTTRFLEMQFNDPNSWVVIEWDRPEDAATVVKTRPFEVPAEQAVNFFIANDEIKWLVVKQPISYIEKAGNDRTKEIRKDGFRWTLYEETYTIVLEQAEPKHLQAIGYEYAPNETLVTIDKISYIQRIAEPKIGYVPAFRVGYKRDELTNGRTFVNPWHDALCFFEKSLKTVSELDLTQALHTFPQKLQYVHKCKGTPATETTARRSCNGGLAAGTQDICRACNGNGYKLHTTAQDAVLIPLPDSDPKNEDIIDLQKLIHYVSPPIELIKFQNDYALQLENQARQAVYNSQMFAQKTGGGITEMKTATELDINYQSVYDTLEPFTEKYSEMWREIITIFAVIASEPLEKIDITHEFPADPKLKNSEVLLTERKAAKESGAPAFLVETIDDDLASIIYTGDDLGMRKYRTKRRYFPFSGKNEDEIALLLASEFVPVENKILYSNFEQIFKEIQNDDPGFWAMKVPEQDKIVSDKLAEWVEKINAAKPAPPMFGNFRNEETPEDEEETNV
jgi:hypothetical protein